MTSLTFFVPGIPAPQGSKRHVGNGRLIESSKTVAGWRRAIADVAQATAHVRGWTVPDACDVDICFHFDRPQGHYGTGRNADQLKDSAPGYHAVRPDTDKLIRAVFDALTTSAVIHDDANVVCVSANKRYTRRDLDGDMAGAEITITSLDEDATAGSKSRHPAGKGRAG